MSAPHLVTLPASVFARARPIAFREIGGHTFVDLRALHFVRVPGTPVRSDTCAIAPVPATGFVAGTAQKFSPSGLDTHGGGVVADGGYALSRIDTCTDECRLSVDADLQFGDLICCAEATTAEPDLGAWWEYVAAAIDWDAEFLRQDDRHLDVLSMRGDS